MSASSSSSSSFLASSLAAAAPAAGAAAPPAAPAAGAPPPAPTLTMKSSIDFFSTSLAKRDGQYGSTSTPAALVRVAILSAWESVCGREDGFEL